MGGILSPKYPTNLQEVEKAIILASKQGRKYDAFTCRISFNSLLNNSKFLITKELIYFCEQFSYTIAVDNFKKQFLKKRYHQVVTEEERNIIILQIVESIFNEINSVIDNSNGNDND